MTGVLRRPRTLGLAFLVAVAIVAGAAGAWGWLTGFRAARRPVPGTPFVLLVQDGVPPATVQGIQQGLHAASGYLAGVVGVPLARPVEVRVTWTDGCQPPWNGPTSGSQAWTTTELICLNPRHPAWQQGERSAAWYAAFVTAHETVHAWTAQLGCLHRAEEHPWVWLSEGSADHFAFEALRRAGLVRPDTPLDRIRALGGFDPALHPLAAYERSGPEVGRAYPLFHFAAWLLMSPPGGSPAQFAGFCRAEAAGRPWRQAFESSFRLDPGTFAGWIDQERRRVAGGSLPDRVPRAG